MKRKLTVVDEQEWEKKEQKAREAKKLLQNIGKQVSNLDQAKNAAYSFAGYKYQDAFQFLQTIEGLSAGDVVATLNEGIDDVDVFHSTKRLSYQLKVHVGPNESSKLAGEVRESFLSAVGNSSLEPNWQNHEWYFFTTAEVSERSGSL